MNIINILESMILSYLSHCIKIYLFIYQPSHFFFFFFFSLIFLSTYIYDVCMYRYIFVSRSRILHILCFVVCFHLVAYDKQLSVDSILNVRTTF